MKPKRILHPVSSGETSQGQGSKDATDSSRSEKLADLKVSITGVTKERVCPSVKGYIVNYLCTLLLDGIILQQAWKKRIEEAGGAFHANVKKGTYYSRV